MDEKEYIERGALLTELERLPHLERSAGSMIRSAPAADVVEVVRCKDCIYHFEDNDGNFDPNNIFCGRHCDNGFTKHDFCSYGERKMRGNEIK